MGCPGVHTPQGRNRVLCKASSPKINGPHGGWTGPSFPQGYSLSWGSPDSPIPTFRPPQVDPPSALSPPPACPPGPGEFRHPSLQLQLHSGPGAEPVSVASSLGGGATGGGAGLGWDGWMAGWGGETEPGRGSGSELRRDPAQPRPTSDLFLPPAPSAPVTSSPPNTWSAISAARGQPSVAR